MSLQKIAAAALVSIAVTLVVLTATTAGLLSINRTVSSTGAVTAINVGVYSNSLCTHELTSIDWGTVSPGNSESRTIYLKNTGNAQMTLSMDAANWNPANADGPITLTWDKETATLDPNQVTAATITLSISESITGITSYSVDIVITGTEN